MGIEDRRPPSLRERWNVRVTRLRIAVVLIAPLMLLQPLSNVCCGMVQTCAAREALEGTSVAGCCPSATSRAAELAMLAPCHTGPSCAAHGSRCESRPPLGPSERPGGWSRELRDGPGIALPPVLSVPKTASLARLLTPDTPLRYRLPAYLRLAHLLC
jgi:hypothetical protein